MSSSKKNNLGYFNNLKTEEVSQSQVFKDNYRPGYYGLDTNAANPADVYNTESNKPSTVDVWGDKRLEGKIIPKSKKKK
ncbi:hypothetical protein AMV185 [Betaentomopoxvirus amoorei]|uniref:Uncharacterized protein AMV185/G3L n=1 Tax=Amsacta moorei entomopoxvirus TaxID=28321 RepID=V185_AMEPV|nr:hypothetical protein AMV185 [Amsacta moorei entomopoxvirus]P29819.1 RecName: Full=Uncharacterized protein AMV185/G3L [Amsacta moorei entomopoxvirus]AAA42381.1 G3L ORF [unidentified entomopoxvirus]AAG02891.1 AMV185 [Amsacta moorei entomopoxvirus]